MKVIYNGGLNASILDGWWARATIRRLAGASAAARNTRNRLGASGLHREPGPVRYAGAGPRPAVLPARPGWRPARLGRQDEELNAHAQSGLQHTPHAARIHGELLHSGPRSLPGANPAGQDQQPGLPGLVAARQQRMAARGNPRRPYLVRSAQRRGRSDRPGQGCPGQPYPGGSQSPALLRPPGHQGVDRGRRGDRHGVQGPPR
jgi:hypothetical protein